MKKIKTVTFTFDRNDFPKTGEWCLNGNVFFNADFNFMESKYDIYTKTETEEVWKPKVGDAYYLINEFLSVDRYAWESDSIDNEHFNIGNCFQTEAEAQAMADKFKELLKGN